MPLYAAEIPESEGLLSLTRKFHTVMSCQCDLQIKSNKVCVRKLRKETFAIQENVLEKFRSYKREDILQLR